MTVCEVIIGVRGNPLMRALGADMKRMLEGKCCVCSCILYMNVRLYVCVSWRACPTQTTSLLSIPQTVLSLSNWSM